jgi:hypothetical protein
MATVPFSFECSKDAGFVMGPNEHKRVGYVVALQVLGIEAALKKDLAVAVPLIWALRRGPWARYEPHRVLPARQRWWG